MTSEQRIQALAQKGCPVFYFLSSEGYLARQAAGRVCQLLLQGETERTVLDEAAPPIEAVVMAAGTISFFGTRRLVYLPNLEPGAYGEKDFADFCDAISSAENAVFVLVSTYIVERGKPRMGKPLTKLADLCRKLGCVEDIPKLEGAALREHLIARAAGQGATLQDTAARALLEQSGEDAALLENEVDKLCALADYGTVTAAMVAQLGTPNLEADVFEMVKLVTAKNSTAACKKLQQLLALQNEPISIAAALTGSYVDMYRVKLGQSAKKNYNAVHSDFGYKGSPYRLKYTQETASRYTLPQLKRCLAILDDLDAELKGSPVDAQIQLETALCRLCRTGAAG